MQVTTTPVAAATPTAAAVPTGPMPPTPGPLAPAAVTAVETLPMPATSTTAPAPPAGPAVLPTVAAAPGPQQGLAIPFWTPRNVQVVASTLHDGMLPAAADAIRGGLETSDGQRLSVAQVATLAPFYAKAYGRAITDVTHDLRDVRIRTGGPAAGKQGWAVTFGPSVYVDSDKEVREILDWSGRRWLSHELGHTMQWGRIDANDDLGRTRIDLAEYVGGFVHAAGPGHGALVDATAGWLGERLHHVPVDERTSMSSMLHDTHPMEREAEQHAQEFLRLTSLGATPNVAG